MHGWSFFSLKKVCWSDYISSSAQGMMSVWPHGSTDTLCLSCPLTTRFLCSWSSSQKRLSNKPHIPGLSHLKSDSDPMHLCWPLYLRMGLHCCRIFLKASWSGLVKVEGKILLVCFNLCRLACLSLNSPQPSLWALMAEKWAETWGKILLHFVSNKKRKGTSNVIL